MSYRKHRKNIGFGVVVALLFTVAALITFSPQLGLEVIPTWNDIFAETQLTTPKAAVSGEFSMHVIDVGQGDSILIQSPTGNVLIDAGESSSGQTVVDYLESQGVSRLNYVIATHPHADHIGGMAKVIEQIQVDQVIMPTVPDDMVPTTRAYLNFLEAVDQKGLAIHEAKLLRQYRLGDGAEFTILGPVEPDDEMNNNSVVLRFTYGDTAFLLTGDCEKSMEKMILQYGEDISCDVLKVGHHGSSTSTRQELLDRVRPSYAAISCGKGNDYGHPHRDTVERLRGAGVQINRTDLDGTIVYESDGTGVSVRTENGET